jgi:hypothetical protein
MGAPCIRLEDLRFDALANAVRMRPPSSGDAPLTPNEIQGLLQRVKLT